jgi:predicted acetyltransferase
MDGENMKKVSSMPLIFLFTILLTGCSFDKETKETTSVDVYRSWLIASVDNSFRLEMHMFMVEFTIILDEIKSKESNEQYVAGRIDGFLDRPNASIEEVLTNLDAEIYENFMNPELRTPLAELILNVRLLVREIRENGIVLDEETSNELIRLSKIVNSGGSNRFVEKETSNEILTSTEEINEILQGYVDSEG